MECIRRLLYPEGNESLWGEIPQFLRARASPARGATRSIAMLRYKFIEHLLIFATTDNHIAINGIIGVYGCFSKRYL